MSFLIYPTVKQAPILGMLGMGGGIARARGASGPEIGDSYEGGFFAGYISANANGVATHGLIVAPNASGTNGGTPLKVKTSQSATSGTTSTYDGAANTANMNNSTHPAGQYCSGLSIGGYSDWYLPAFYEIEIAYYNLRPVNVANILGDGISPGTNAYSVPSRASTNYTNNPATPGQTSVSIFQAGGSEAFDHNTSSGEAAKYHWTSTQFGSGDCNLFNFYNNGQQGDRGKTVTHQIRAFRKFAA